MSTAVVSQFYDLDNILHQYKQQQQQQQAQQAALSRQQSQMLPSLPMEKKVVGSPVASRHRAISCSNTSPMSSPSKYNPALMALTESYTHSQVQRQESYTSQVQRQEAINNQVAHNNLLNSLQNAGGRKFDRSMSDPMTADMRGQGPSKNSNINPSRYKTEMCRPFEENGHCKYGDKCQFAHGRHELRNLARHPKYKTELCRTFHTVGFCPYGPRCHFIHNEDERKLNYIIQQKQQQAVQQAAQQVVQHAQQLQIQAASHPAPIQRPRQSLPQSMSMPVGHRDVLGSCADSPPASMPDTPQSMSPTFGMNDLEVFSPMSSYSSSSSCGSTTLTPPPTSAFCFPQEFSSALSSHVTTNPTPVMSPLNIQTDLIASLVSELQAANLNSRQQQQSCDIPHPTTAPVAPQHTDLFQYTPPSPPDSINGDGDCLDTSVRGLRLPIFSRLSED